MSVERILEFASGESSRKNFVCFDWRDVCRVMKIAGPGDTILLDEILKPDKGPFIVTMTGMQRLPLRLRLRLRLGDLMRWLRRW